MPSGWTSRPSGWTGYLAVRTTDRLGCTLMSLSASKNLLPNVHIHTHTNELLKEKLVYLYSTSFVSTILFNLLFASKISFLSALNKIESDQMTRRKAVEPCRL